MENGTNPQSTGTMELVIRLDAKGHISVMGPIANEVLAYGMLDLARYTIRDHNVRRREAPAQ